MRQVNTIGLIKKESLAELSIFNRDGTYIRLRILISLPIVYGIPNRFESLEHANQLDLVSWLK